jgi:DNA-binding SARP family transcriptional activator
MIARSPYRESGYRLLMLALARGGNSAEALHVYERLRGLLRAELGIVPSAGMRELHASLLQAGAGSGTAGPNPSRELSNRG